MHMTIKIFSGWNGYGNIIFQGQSQHSCLKIYFPAKTDSQSQHRDSNLAPKPTANQEAAEKSRLVFFLQTAWTGRHQCLKKLVSFETKTKLDPSGGGKGGPISKLLSTLNKVVFRRLSKLYVFFFSKISPWEVP